MTKLRPSWLLFGLALPLAGGCGGSRASAPVPDDRARAEDKLQGEWVLTAFRPTPPLEPMYQALLEAQLNQLKVTFRAGALGIQGVGVQGARSYRVVDATDIGFSGVITDAAGAEYQVTGVFRGVNVDFVSHTAPWRGTGWLHRVR
jgi:hypothetical protein